MMNLLLILLLISHPCSAKTLAKINRKVITLKEFNQKYRSNLRFFNANKKPTKRNVLDDLVKRELGIQEARRLGLHKRKDIRDRIDTVIYQALVEKKLGPKFNQIKISDGQARNYYKSNPEIRASHIFVGVKPGSSKAVERKARARISMIQTKHLPNMPFKKAAQRYSEGVAAPLGGDIDYQMRDRLDPAFYAAALKLKVGQVSPIVRTQFGFHIIKLTARRPWAETNQSRVKRMLFEQEKEKVFERYMRSLRKKAKVQVRYELLR